MEFYFTVTCQLILEHEQGAPKSQHVATQYTLEPGPGLDQSKYVNGVNLTHDGAKVTTDVLLSAIVGHIHYCHEKGIKDSAEHFREIIRKMETQFIEVPKIRPGKLR